jgi:thymidine phosphorylase
VVALGGGRLRSDQVIDPAVGFTGIVELGAAVKAGDPLLTIHARTPEGAKAAADMALAAMRIGPEKPADPPLVWQRITKADCSE